MERGTIWSDGVTSYTTSSSDYCSPELLSERSTTYSARPVWKNYANTSYIRTTSILGQCYSPSYRCALSGYYGSTTQFNSDKHYRRSGTI